MQELEWFVRDATKSELMDKLDPIARLAIKLGFDYMEDLESLQKCIDVFLPLKDMTSEELLYACTVVQNKCSFEVMADEGLFKRTSDGGYSITKKGEAKRKRIRNIKGMQG